jgi:PmbA protein
MDAIKENFLKIQEQAAQDKVFVELLVTGSEDLSFSFSKKKMDKFNSSQNQTAGFRVVLGSAQGYAWTENFSRESFLRTYREALQNARVLPQSGKDLPTLTRDEATENMSDMYAPEEIAVEDKIAKALELEATALDFDPRISSVPYNGFAETKRWRRILNSAGLDKEFKQSYYSGYVYPLAKQGETSKIEGKSFVARKFADTNAAAVAREASEKVLSHLGAQKLVTGKYPVVMDREVARDLIGMLGGYFSAKNIFEKKSLLQGKLGQRMASSRINLLDDPLDKRVLGARPFDAEGSASRPTVLIEKGVIKNFLTNLEYADKMNLPPTASASRGPTSDMDIAASNLILSKGESSLPDLLKRHAKTIHLTSITGGLHSGFKYSTGDFSLPGEAFLYENGTCVGPVDQFVFSGNIFEMLRDVEDLGREYCDFSGSTLVPDLLIKELSFAGA